MNHNLLTESKNEVERERTELHQNEAGQMSNSAIWLEKEYGKAVPVTLLMMHPAEDLANSAYPPAKTMVMTLEKLYTRLCAFAGVLSSKFPEAWTATENGALLANHRLDAGSIRKNARTTASPQSVSADPTTGMGASCQAAD